MARPVTSSDERIDALRGRSLADRYQLGDLRARGALSAVYDGTDVVLQRRVAVKVAPLEHADAYREALNATAALSYPTFLATYDVFEQDGLFYMVQEHIDGRPLSAYEEDGAPTRRAVALALQLARAVAYAHQHDLAHGDLTPSAILIDRTAFAHINNVQLPADWDYFLRVAASVERSGLTPSAEETIDALHGDAWLRDVWAIGVALWSLITRPTQDEAGRVFREDVTADVRQLVERTLNATHQQSITTAEALALELERIDEDQSRGASRQRDTLPLAIRAFREERSGRDAGMAMGLRRLIEASNDRPADERLPDAPTYPGATDPMTLDRNQTHPADNAWFAGGHPLLQYQPPAYQSRGEVPREGAERARYQHGAAPRVAQGPNPAWPMGHARGQDATMLRPWVWTLIGIALFIGFFLIGYLMFPQLRLF